MTNRSLKSLEFDNAEDDLRHLGLSYVDEKALLVQGATDVSILSLLLEDQNIKIQELSECHAIIKTYEGLQRIASYVQDKRIVLIIDRDTRDDTDIERIKNENPDYFNKYFIVLQKQEIENYLLDPDIIYSVLQDKIKISCPKASESDKDRIKSTEKRYADDMLKSIKNKYINAFINNKFSASNVIIKSWDISIESKAGFDNYIDSVIAGETWSGIY